MKKKYKKAKIGAGSDRGTRAGVGAPLACAIPTLPRRGTLLPAPFRAWAGPCLLSERTSRSCALDMRPYERTPMSTPRLLRTLGQHNDATCQWAPGPGHPHSTSPPSSWGYTPAPPSATGSDPFAAHPNTLRYSTALIRRKLALCRKFDARIASYA